MKVVRLNLEEALENIEGTGSMMDETGQPAKLRNIIRMALANEFKEDTAQGAAVALENKVKLFDLICDIREAGDVITLTPEQAELIKPRIAMTFGSLVVGQVVRKLSKVIDVDAPPQAA